MTSAIEVVTGIIGYGSVAVTEYQSAMIIAALTGSAEIHQATRHNRNTIMIAVVVSRISIQIDDDLSCKIVINGIIRSIGFRSTCFIKAHIISIAVHFAAPRNMIIDFDSAINCIGGII
ncbi:hypothetical protein D3C86_1432230 [compost metagenome]